jgi:hypothetical protein
VPVVSITIADLRAELNHRHDGEDNRITIECQCERRRNVDGRNLERDFDSLMAREAPVAHAVRPPASPRSSGGCMAVAPHLRMVVWLCKLWSHLSEKYDGTVNPAKFLQIYSTSILTAGGDEAIMAN